MLDLSIVIVSWNVCDLLRECLSSIAASNDFCFEGSQRNAEVIVIDSASTDASIDMVQEQFKWVRSIEARSNVGFSKGNNIGIEASQGQFVLLLNPDTRIVDSALSSMVTYLQTHPEVGVVGPKLLNSDGTTQSSRRRFPTFWTAIFESTWFERFAPRRVLDRYYFRDVDENSPASVDWVTGAAFLVRREVIDNVGVFDESFFMYSEELDWQRRIKDARWQIAYLPEAVIVHHGGKSSDQVVPQRHIRFQTSKIRYFRKHHGLLIAGLIRLIILLNYGCQICLESAKGLIGHKRQLRRERLNAYWQVIRSGLRV
jgi:N-acetylglucosaminyl-diphospho-decaprenol L-rhamnosyltransferase